MSGVDAKPVQMQFGFDFSGDSQADALSATANATIAFASVAGDIEAAKFVGGIIRAASQILAHGIGYETTASFLDDLSVLLRGVDSIERLQTRH